jgi:hypothetical protein
MNNNCIGNVQQKKPKTCKKNVHQYADVLLPVKLEPVTIVGEITTECCGEPSVVCKNNCDCHSNNYCELVITQTICIVIPIEYGINTSTGKSNIKCKDRDC